MDAFVITLYGNEYSERVAQRCIDSANIEVRRFPACSANRAERVLEGMGIEWTWGRGYRGLDHKPYGGDYAARVGCFVSHYMLWKHCKTINEPVLILEHDAVFVRDFAPFEFDHICMINDPRGATPRGEWWSMKMIDRGPGVWPKTTVFDDKRPDGLAGNSAYVIKPHAAEKLIRLVDTVGAWPNDALICRQLFDGLQEHFPFITEVQSERSTIQL